MASQLVWSQTTYKASSTFFEGSFPTNLDNTHLLVAIIQAGTATVIATPSGWTLVGGWGSNGANQVRMFIRRSGTDFGFNPTFATASATLTLLAFKGYSSVTPLSAIGGNATSNTTVSATVAAGYGAYGVAIAALGVLNTVTWGSWTTGIRSAPIANAAQRLDSAHIEYNNAAISASISWTTARTSRNVIVVLPLIRLPDITTLSLDGITEKSAFTQTLAANFTTSATWAHTAGTLPAGLSLSSSGVLSGTPSVYGAYDFTVTITDANGTDTQQYTGIITAAPVDPDIPEVLGIATGGVVGSGSFSVTPPPGAAGYLAILSIGTSVPAASAITEPTIPSGFTLYQSGYNHYTAWRIYVGAASASSNWQTTAGWNASVMVIGLTNFEVEGYANGGAQDSPGTPDQNAPSITTTQKSLVVRTLTTAPWPGVATGTYPTNSPNNRTIVQHHNGDEGTLVAIATSNQMSAGSTNTDSFGFSPLNGSTAHTIALRKAATPPRTQEVFTTSGTFTVPADVTSVDVLIVGGGGGGGRAGSSGGGGSGGQVRFESNVPVTPSGTVAITIGNGGAGRAGTTGSGADGASSSFGALTAVGGGAGAGGGASTPGNGAHGGGGQASSSGSRAGGTGIVSYTGGTGHNGSGGTHTGSGSGGGGGAGGNGGNASGVLNTSVTGGNGGPGLDMTAHIGTSAGESGWFGGGGGGGTQADVSVTSIAGVGGNGGGGDGTNDASENPGQNGAPNTGGGGGGGNGSIQGSGDGTTDGGDGGSGVVIIIYNSEAAPPRFEGAIPGTTTVNLSSPTNRWIKPNLRTSWFDGNHWAAVLPTASGHQLYANLANPSAGTTIDTRTGARPTIVYYDGPAGGGTGWVGILRSHPTQSRFSSYFVHGGYVADVIDTIVPLTPTNTDQSPISLIRSPNGYLWAAFMQSNTIQVSRSSDGGTTWGAAQNLGTISGSFSTGIVGLAITGTTVVLIATGNDGIGRAAGSIPQDSVSYSAASWTQETLPTLPSGAASDDHLSMTSTPDGRILAVSKVTNNDTNIVLIYLLVRTVTGTWTLHTVQTGPDGLEEGFTRPGITVSDDTAYVTYGAINSDNLFTRSASLSDLSSWSSITTLLTGPAYGDGAILPDGPVLRSTTGDFPILAHNRNTQDIRLLWAEQTAIPSTTISPNGMVVQVEGVYTASLSNTNKVTVSGIVVPDIPNRALFIGIAFNNNEYQSISSILLNPGGSNTPFEAATSGPSTIDDDGYIGIGYLLNPPVGTHSAEATIDASTGVGEDIIVTVWVLSNVHQTTPVRAFNNTSATGNSTTATVTSAPGDMVLGLGFVEDGVFESLGFHLNEPGVPFGIHNGIEDKSVGGYITANGTSSSLTWSCAPEFTAEYPVAQIISITPAVAMSTPAIEASVTTDPFPFGTADIADGPAIIPDTTNPANSVVIGTNKNTGGGLYVYNLTGDILSSNLDGAANSVDYRDLTGVTSWDNRLLIMTSNRQTNRLQFYWMDRTTKALTSAGTSSALGWEPYGTCLYVHSNGTVYAFVTQRGPDDTSPRSMYQYPLSRSGSTVTVGGSVRTIALNSVVEGLFADDTDGHLYASEEDFGLYRYSAAPSGGSTRTTIDEIGKGFLSADVEDVALANTSAGKKILVSSQGDSSYHVYSASTLKHEKRFTIVRPGGTDLVTATDGLDVHIGNLGPGFANGMIVVHDGDKTPISDYVYVDAALVFENNLTTARWYLGTGAILTPFLLTPGGLVELE